MKQKRPLVLTSIILMLAVANYFRIGGNENIRAIQFLSIFVIGMLSGIILREVIAIVRSNK